MRVDRQWQGEIGGDAQRRRIGWALVTWALFALACDGGPPEIVITTPADGEFFAAGSVVAVQGYIANVDPDAIADVTIEGTSVMPLIGGLGFAIDVAASAGAPLQTIEAVLTSTGGPVLRDRVSIVVGDSIADGDFSLESVALRINESGLDEIEPVVTSLVDIDLATLLPPGTLVIDNFCYQDSFLGCLGRVDVLIHGSPPPSIASFSIDVDPQNGFTEGDIRLNDLAVTARVTAVSGIGFTCYIDIDASTTDILGDYTLEPDAQAPTQVDVTQLGGVSVVFGGFGENTNCAGFLGFIVEALVDLFVGDVQDLMRPALEDFLDTVDAQGNTPTAGAIESALAGVEIAGPIGQELGVTLETPLFAVWEDTGGFTLGSDSRVLSDALAPGAPDLPASYNVDQTFPTFGPITPAGQPYDLGMCVSASAFNQLMKAEIESGLLQQTLTEFDFGQGPAPITAALLGALVPEFQFLPPSSLLRFEITPTMAPIITGEPGPAGELAQLHVQQLVLAVKPIDVDAAFIEVAVDASLGLELTVDPQGLAVDINPPAPGDIDWAILTNRMGTDELTLDALVPLLVQLAVPELAGSLGSFPLPDFLGLQLGLVDVDRNGEFLSLYLDLSAP